MFKKWKALSEFECVKEFGLGHKISHLLGINMISKCFLVVGNNFTKGVIEGIEVNESKKA
ncbi:hypothetical protein [Lederbergia lenta]|uniref:hypothetical protein n=1 Tax=Lederbergia lenta TaxID=1467 RepID=UPI002041F022|nr:hypothetical protein [Lederbergia lenta]MCM3110675.1 hypothetical protein [Lederbergia lenta]